ncbi:MAG TPA: hypothetical protein VMB73_23070 [Acetobacteraceae bacterium]|nr:hypothetical protein [Acetobacteraceae bacterium]
MPIQVATPAIPDDAFLIDQQWTVRSIKGLRVGTKNLMGCMGLVVHAPNKGIGCLAHIEAADSEINYVNVFKKFFDYMTGKIYKYGGNDATLQVALFGNVTWAVSASFGTSIHDYMVNKRVPHAQILDNRNRRHGGPAVFDIGAVPRTEQVITGITYRPAAGDLVVNASPYTAAQPSHVSKFIDWGIRKRQLQP